MGDAASRLGCGDRDECCGGNDQGRNVKWGRDGRLWPLDHFQRWRGGQGPATERGTTRTGEASCQGPVKSIVWVLALVFLIEASMYSALTPLLPGLVVSLDLSKSAVGVLVSSYLVGICAGAVAGAWITRLLGFRRSCQTALVVIAMSVLGFAVATSFSVALLARVVGGFAGGIAWVAALSWLFSSSSPARRGATVGTAMSVATFGTLIGPVIGNAAIVGGQIPVFAAVAATCLVCAMSLPKNDTAVRRAVVERPAERTRRHHKRRALAVDLWLYSLLAFTYGALFVLLPLRLSTHAVSPALIGWIFALAALLSAVVASIVGRMVDRRGTFGFTFASMIGGGALLLGFAFNHNSALEVALALLGVGIVLAIGISPNATAVSASSNGFGHAGPTTSMFLLVAFSGSEAIGGMAIPVLADATSDRVAFLALFAATAASVVMAWSCRPVPASASIDET